MLKTFLTQKLAMYILSYISALLFLDILKTFFYSEGQSFQNLVHVGKNLSKILKNLSLHKILQIPRKIPQNPFEVFKSSRSLNKLMMRILGKKPIDYPLKISNLSYPKILKKSSKFSEKISKIFEQFERVLKSQNLVRCFWSDWPRPSFYCIIFFHIFVYHEANILYVVCVLNMYVDSLVRR